MTTDMTKGPIIPQLTEFTIPLVLGNLPAAYRIYNTTCAGKSVPAYI